MITATLLGYAVLAGSLGVRLLRGRRWLDSSPRLGILVWLVLSGTIPLAILAAALSILTATSAGHSVADLLHACITMLRNTFAGPLAPTGATLLGVGLAVLVVRVPVLFTAELFQGHLTRRAQQSRLWLVASHRIPGDGLLIVEHPLPVAFCLPGRARTIVVTSAAVASLSHDQLTAVLAHERAHLRGRHHLVLAWSRAVAQGLRFLPALRWVISEQARLLEMAADDRAASSSSRQALATALLRLVDVPFGVRTLGAVQHAVSARVERLVSVRRRQTRISTWVALSAFTILAGLPGVFVSVAWVTATRTGHCPID